MRIDADPMICSDAEMTPEQRSELKNLIQNELELLALTLEHLAEAGQAVSPDNALGRLTRVDSMLDQNMAVAKRNNLLERQQQLQEALRRIDSPGFGVCVSCKQPVPIERLLVLPETRVCVPCLNRAQQSRRR